MILASIEGHLMWLVIAGFIGGLKWIFSQLASAKKGTPQNLPMPRGSAASPRPAHPESEEERMRRFLEALGLPADGRPAPPPRPVPQMVAPRRPVPPPLQPQHRASFHERRPAPVTRVEKIVMPELAVPSVPDFETISSKVSAVPMEFPATRDDADRPPGPTIGETLRAALASPQQLRSAFILSEVFGTPPGLRPS
jgi:hypothetical protein